MTIRKTNTGVRIKSLFINDPEKGLPNIVEIGIWNEGSDYFNLASLRELRSELNKVIMKMSFQQYNKDTDGS